MNLFILYAQKDPLLFVSVMLTLVVSITLHELAHGWAAIRQGDDTPIESGHMTLNPIVHMGPASVVLMLVAGLAWGAMPVNPLRFRNRYGHALVCAAGPAVNLLLALAALGGLAAWLKHTGFWDEHPNTALAGTQQFLWYFGRTNMVLAIFNLIPLPPLDGSGILANFHRGYRELIERVTPGMAMGLIIGLIVVLSYTDVGLWDLSDGVSLRYVNAISGLHLHMTEG